MEKKKRALQILLALLISLPVAFGGGLEEPCCDWAESGEWPLEASQCPASLHGANATYCCGFCYAPHSCPFEEPVLEKEECLADHLDEYPSEEQMVAVSGSPNISLLESVLPLILPVVFLIVFLCVWLFLNCDDNSEPRPAPSFVRPPLRLRYGACTVAVTPRSVSMSSLVPKDLLHPSGEANVLSHQATSEMPGEEEVSTSTPATLQEEPPSGAASGAAPEAASGAAPEAASGAAPEAASGDGSSPKAQTDLKEIFV